MARRRRNQEESGLDKLLKVAQVQNLISNPQQQAQGQKISALLGVLGLLNSQQDREARVGESAADRGVREKQLAADDAFRTGRAGAEDTRYADESKTKKEQFNRTASIAEEDSMRAWQKLEQDKSLGESQLAGQERGQTLGFIEGLAGRTPNFSMDMVGKALGGVDPQMAAMFSTAGADAEKSAKLDALVAAAQAKKNPTGMTGIKPGANAGLIDDPVTMSMYPQGSIVQWLNKLTNM